MHRTLFSRAGRSLLLILAASALSILLMSGCSPKKATRVLVLYENGGHHKPFTDVFVPWLSEVGEDNGMEFTFIKRTDVIDKEYLSGFDVFLQLDYPPYTWPEKAMEAFTEAIEGGTIGWVGMHHATLLGEFDGYPMWEWFSDFLGGIRFQNYIADLSDGTVHIEDPLHPAVKGLDTSFVIEDDEWYTYDVNPRSGKGIHVIATVDEGSYTLDTQVKMGDHPVIWTNEDKAARNIYFQFSHSPKLLENNAYKTLLLNSIKWAAGKDSKK